MQLSLHMILIEIRLGLKEEGDLFISGSTRVPERSRLYAMKDRLSVTCSNGSATA
jgi:hypothetical protein